MPQLQSYDNDTPTSDDEFLFWKKATNVLKNSTFATLATAVKNAISSFFTSSSVVPSTAPAAGKLLIGNSGGTAYAPQAVSGDATLAFTGALTIADNSVTYAKMQNVSAASKLLGRGAAAGAGDPQEITLGSGLAMVGTTISAT